jgi:hypothetical protein
MRGKLNYLNRGQAKSPGTAGPAESVKRSTYCDLCQEREATGGREFAEKNLEAEIENWPLVSSNFLSSKLRQVATAARMSSELGQL